MLLSLERLSRCPRLPNTRPRPPGRRSRTALSRRRLVPICRKRSCGLEASFRPWSGTPGQWASVGERVGVSSRSVTEEVHLTPEVVARQLVQPKILCIERWTGRGIQRSFLWKTARSGVSCSVASPESFSSDSSGRTGRRGGAENTEPRGARSGPNRAGRSSIDAVCEHLVRMLAQRGHQQVKRRLDRRIVSIEIGGRLLEAGGRISPDGQARQMPDRARLGSRTDPAIDSRACVRAAPCPGPE